MTTQKKRARQVRALERLLGRREMWESYLQPGTAVTEVEYDGETVDPVDKLRQTNAEIDRLAQKGIRPS